MKQRNRKLKKKEMNGRRECINGFLLLNLLNQKLYL
jgi:hypothetical protein